MFSPKLRHFVSAALTAASVLLASCGGGGSVGDAATTRAFPPSSTLANMCTLDGQKQFVRSFLDETYLWYDEIPVVNAADYATVPAYFKALLVKPKDRFSAVLTSSAADARQSVPNELLASSGVTANLVPANGKSVPLARVVASPKGRRVGYVLFNDHTEGAQDELITAFDKLRTAGVDDLVLDMRYNAGGFLYIALTAASLVTGPQSEGRIFEQLRYSARRQSENPVSSYLYSNRVQTPEPVYPRGTPLPQLNLPRLYVLTSDKTCSASESIINSLRGIDIEVITVGATTCGKPFGFHRQDNCGLAFFPIEFQGYNARNFGDYTSGFPPTCPVADNFLAALGSTTEPLLAAALFHSDTGSCPAATAARLSLREPVGGRANAPLTTRQQWDGRQLK